MMVSRYPDRILVSPATGHADTEWFDQFWAECELLGCRFDYVTIYLTIYLFDYMSKLTI